MSELKSYKLFHRASALTSPEFISIVEFGKGDEVYDKDEADKVITHHKYKRCLAIARWCRESLRLMRTYEVTDDYWNLEPGQDAEYFCKKGDFYSKWQKRWLELAEKFKEGK